MQRKPRGQTLIEILLASTIFATAFLSLVGVYPVTHQASRLAQTQVMANHVAEMQMEAAVAKPFDSLSSTALAYVPMMTSNHGVAQVTTYSWQLIVTPNVGGQANLKDVRCRVQWSDGSLHYIDVETLVWK